MPTALITGGTTGIGRATAELLHSRGYHVAVTGQNPDSLAAARRELPDDVLIVRADARVTTDTSLFDKLGVGSAGRDALRANIPFQRLGSSREVAEVVAFLASDAAGYVTGQDLAVAGGYGLGA